MIALATLSTYWFKESADDEPKGSYASSLYEIISAIFRVVAMTLQYVVVKVSVSFRHWCWLPSALPKENIRVVSRNIANFETLQQCVSTAWHPYPKKKYHDIGLDQGLRITHDIILRPASGLCLGKSLTFLSKYLLFDDDNDRDNLMAAVQIVQGEENGAAIELQAIYDALIGVEGRVQPSERDFFFRLIQGHKCPLQKTSYPELLVSVDEFLSFEDESKSFRRFILDDLEKDGIELSVDLYVLILELDTLWHLLHHPEDKKNDSTHQAIIQAVADFADLTSFETIRLRGTIPIVTEQLEDLDQGSYLIQFSNHTIALVKTRDHFAIFEPNEGLAIFNDLDHEENFTQLLEYYGSNDNISLKVIPIMSKS